MLNQEDRKTLYRQTKTPAKKILVAMSGGVDSAISAYLLKEENHQVTGANMRLWEYPSDSPKYTSEAKNDTDVSRTKKRNVSCCSPEDLGDAEASARYLDIPFYTIKMEKQFQEKVIQPFIQDYIEAKTPNPCVHCNTFVKFGEFFEKASALGFDYIATGHYASVEKRHNGRYAIFPAKDASKDQSYYLYGLSQEALAKIIFPLAEYLKEEVRRIALNQQIPVAEKPESQEICFIPDNNYRAFLGRQNVTFQKGFILDIHGRILGKHNGKENYTIGQRKGLGIARGRPQYVLEIRPDGNIVIGDKDELNKKVFYARDVVFQGLAPNELHSEGIEVMAQVRYNSKPVHAIIFCEDTSTDGEGTSVRVELSEPCFAITPGQAAVFYHKKEGCILAGGKIAF